jgi:hypothetical protein
MAEAGARLRHYKSENAPPPLLHRIYHRAPPRQQNHLDALQLIFRSGQGQQSIFAHCRVAVSRRVLANCRHAMHSQLQTPPAFSPDLQPFAAQSDWKTERGGLQ